MKKMFAALAMMAISSIALAAPPLTFCTGGPNGGYESMGKSVGKAIVDRLRNTSPTELKVLNTGGSIDNGEKIQNGSCVMAIMQADAIAARGLRGVKVTNVYQEAIYWMHNKNGIQDFADMSKEENKNLGIAYVKGSGVAATLDNFGAVDEDYKDLNLIEFDDWEYAADAAAEGFTEVGGKNIKIAGMLYISRPGMLPASITGDYSNALQIGDVDEESFTKAKDYNGNQLYTVCEIKRGDTGPMKTSGWGNPDTLCMNAQIVFNNEYLDSVPEAERQVVKKAVLKGTNQIVRNSAAAQ